MEIALPRRFRGPLTSANGGYTCGRLAAFVRAPAVEVTLRQPPLLDRPLVVREEGELTVLLDGDVLVAEARAAALDFTPPEAVSLEAAEAARDKQPHAFTPLFRECFVCGMREDGDGLGIHVGPVAGREPLRAAPWIVDEPADELVWAAIDCPGAYAVGAEGRGEVVLGRMTCSVHRVPDVGESCVVAAWPLGEDGRKLDAGTALYAEDGELLALARQTWILPRASGE